MAVRKKRPAPAKKPGSTRPLPRLPAQQLSLPAGYRRGSNDVASLRDVLSTNVRTVDGGRLTPEQRIALTKERIAAQDEFKIASPTAGRIDKARALDEVERQTPLGRILVKIEHQAIDFLRQTANIRRRRRIAGKTTRQSSRSSKPGARRRSRPSARRRRR